MDLTSFRPLLAALTPTEERVVRLRCRGLQNKEIANACYVQPQTIKNHLTRIFARLDIDGGGRSALACYWIGRLDAERGVGEAP